MDKDDAKKLPYPLIHKDVCKGCGRCIQACPKNVLKMSEEFNGSSYHYAEYIGEGCIGCANCYYTCPEPLALEVHVQEKKTKTTK